MAEAYVRNLFNSPVGMAVYPVFHEPRKWDETQGRSVKNMEKGEFFTGLVIGNDEGKHFKSIVDGYVQKKFSEVVEQAFEKLKEEKPKKAGKFKSAMEWQKAEDIFSCLYPYEQLEDDDGEALDAWKFKFRKKHITRYKDKKTGEMKEFKYNPQFANRQGENLDQTYFDENGLIANDSELRIKYNPYCWKNPKNEVGVTLEMHSIQIIEHIPYVNGGGQAKSNEPLFDPI